MLWRCGRAMALYFIGNSNVGDIGGGPGLQNGLPTLPNERTSERAVMVTGHSIGSIGDAGAGWIETYSALRMDIIVLRCLPPFRFWRGRLCIGLAG